MRRKLAGLALGLAAMAMLALSGCGAMTPEKLAGKIRQAVEKTPCSQMEMNMVVDMTMAEPTSGIEMDLGIRMAGQMQMSYDPDTAYENLEVTVEMMGIRMPANMEIYVLQEGGRPCLLYQCGGKLDPIGAGGLPADRGKRLRCHLGFARRAAFH